MKIKSIKISPQNEIKINDKHGVTMDEIKNTFLQNRPYFSKTRDGRYAALGKWNKHLTIIFNYDEKFREAEIITAYPSSSWQIKLYKKKRK